MTRYISPIKIGLTGGVGSGKTSVSDYLATQRGFLIIDTDVISRDMASNTGIAMPALRKLIAAGWLPKKWINHKTGALVRHIIRQDCFSHPELRLKLESVLHPLIREHALTQAEKAPHTVMVFVVPLLIENEWWKNQVDQIWVVDTSIETQLQRVLSRSIQQGSPMNEETAQQIIKAQVSRSERLQHAHYIIDNQKDLSHLHRQVSQLVKTTLKLRD